VGVPAVNWSDFLTVSLASLGGTAVLMIVTALIGARIGRHNVVDVTWGGGFVLIALISAATGTGELWRRVLLLVLVGVWGLRLAVHVFRRSRGHGEDPRYTEMLAKAPGNETLYALRKIYLTQAVALWFVSLPLQVSAVAHGSVLPVVVLGVLVWILGWTFEAVGDAQLKAFKADSSNKGRIMDRGLWAWTRHPNYFGDSAVWWGLFLVSASAWPGVFTLLSPIAMTYFLVFATGARLLERSMEKRPGYREYQQRTSYFLPRPPKQHSK
jgi:steroid 5-alpha reductase family enzyme